MAATRLVQQRISRGGQRKPVGSDLGTRGVWFVSTQRSFPPSDNRTTVSSPQLTARIFSELFTRSVKTGSSVSLCSATSRTVKIFEREKGAENSTGLHVTSSSDFTLISAYHERIPVAADKSAGSAARGQLSHHVSGVKEDVDAARRRRVDVVFHPKATVAVLPPWEHLGRVAALERQLTYMSR